MTLEVAHILVTHRYEAEDLQRRLKAGEDFHHLAQKHSQCSSRVAGGRLGKVAINRLDPDFAEAALSLKDGEMSEVVRTRFGYHLILMLSAKRQR